MQRNVITNSQPLKLNYSI